MKRRVLVLSLLLISALATLSALPVKAQPRPTVPPAGVLKFHEPLFHAADSATEARIAVDRLGGARGAVSVTYHAAAGTAAAGTDFTPADGTLQWADGDATPKSFVVPVLPGGAPHGGKTVQLGLADPTGGAVVLEARRRALLILGERSGGGGQPPAAGLIGFDSREYGAVESAGRAVITVLRRGGTTGAVSVDFATGESNGEAGVDFTPASGTLSWADGEGGPKSFFVPLIDDDEPNRPLYVRLGLSNPTGGAELPPPVQHAVLGIRDDDHDGPGGPEAGPGVFHFGAPRFQTIEGNEALIRVERSRGREGEVSVDFSTADGSAVAGEDYTPVAGTLTWANGEAGPKVFRVPTIANPEGQGYQTVNLSLSDPTGGATIHPELDSAILGILDRDGDRTPCTPDDTTLCLARGRFRVNVTWRTGDGNSGPGHAVRLNGQSGTFWFFDEENSEMLIKVLDACGVNRQYWVFFAATTDVNFTVQVTDTATGLLKEYTSALGEPAEPVQDTLTFPCE